MVFRGSFFVWQSQRVSLSVAVNGRSICCVMIPIRFQLNYSGPVDPDMFRTAGKTLAESVDKLHGTFFPDDTMASWLNKEAAGGTNHFHYMETEGDPAKTAASLSRRENGSDRSLITLPLC